MQRTLNMRAFYNFSFCFSRFPNGYFEAEKYEGGCQEFSIDIIRLVGGNALLVEILKHCKELFLSVLLKKTFGRFSGYF